jgi:hypothetical protein
MVYDYNVFRMKYDDDLYVDELWWWIMMKIELCYSYFDDESWGYNCNVSYVWFLIIHAFICRVKNIVDG